MPVHVKVGGAWKQATAVFNKVGGVWKTAADMPVKIAGVWKTGILASGAYESIATLSGSGSNTITFSSIPSTYKSLQIRFMGLTTGGADSPRIRFNSDTGNNYAYHYLVGPGSDAPYVYGLASTNSIFTSQNNAYNVPIVGIIDIHDYANTSKYKTTRSITGFDSNNVSNQRINLYSGLWMNTSAITSLTLFNTNGEPWNSASSFALYGIKGA